MTDYKGKYRRAIGRLAREYTARLQTVKAEISQLQQEADSLQSDVGDFEAILDRLQKEQGG